MVTWTWFLSFVLFEMDQTNIERRMSSDKIPFKQKLKSRNISFEWIRILEAVEVRPIFFELLKHLKISEPVRANFSNTFSKQASWNLVEIFCQCH